MRTPFFSVVIPLYNKAPYFHRALDSLASQTFRDFEVVVVDDGSTDGGAKLARGRKDLNIRVVTQKNRGLSATRNRGMRLARAPYVALLDADDEYLPGFLAAIHRLALRYPQAGAYGTAYLMKKKLVWRKTRYRGIPPGFEGLLPNYILSSLGHPPLQPCSVALRKSVLRRSGWFRDVHSEDLDMWLRIALKAPIAYCNIHLAVYHWGLPDSMGLAKTKDYLPHLELVERTLKDRNLAPAHRGPLAEYRNLIQLKRSRILLFNGKPGEARALLGPLTTNVYRFRRWLLLAFTLFPPVFYSMFRKLRQWS